MVFFNFFNTVFNNNREFLFFLILIVLIIFSCKKDSPTEGEEGHSAKKWTFMLYDDADFSNAYDPLNDFAANIRSDDDLNVLVLQDTEGASASIKWIREDGEPITVNVSGEVNMGSYDALYDFLEYVKNEYPADKYIISFYDHGAGWMGACVDVTSDNDILTMDEMQRALTDAGGVNIVCFSAPCLMGALESAYELRNCTEVYIASENYSGYMWWIETMHDIFSEIKSDPEISCDQLGDAIITSIRRNSYDYGEQYCMNLTMSAVCSENMNELKDAIDEVSVAYLSNIEKFRDHADSLYNNITMFGGLFADVYDFAENFLILEDDPDIRSKLENVKSAFLDVLISECRGSGWPNAHCLSIYFPVLPQAYYSTNYYDAGYGLDFTRDTHWDEVLSALRGVGKIKEDIHMDIIPAGTNGFIYRH